MASYLTPRPLIIQNENLDLLHKSSAFDRDVKCTKAAAKKDGGGLGSRKALNDITYKEPLKSEALTRKRNRNVTKEEFKKNIPKEGFNVPEEGFLHDHTKCLEEQKSTLKYTSFLDLVLPGHDSVPTAEDLKVNQVKTDLDDKFFFPQPTEMSMSAFSDWFESLTKWSSPPDSPIDWDSPPSSPFAWQFESKKMTDFTPTLLLFVFAYS